MKITIEFFMSYLKNNTQIYEDTILGFYYRFISDFEEEYKNVDEFLKEFIKFFNLVPTNVYHPAMGRLYTYTI